MRGRHSRRPMVACRRDERFCRGVPGLATHHSAVLTTNHPRSVVSRSVAQIVGFPENANDCPVWRGASRRAASTLRRRQYAIDLRCGPGEGQVRGSIHGVREIRAGTTEGGALRTSYACLLQGPQSLVLPANDAHDFAPRGLSHAQTERQRLGHRVGQSRLAHQADLTVGVDHVLAIALFAVQDRSAGGALGELA